MAWNNGVKRWCVSINAHWKNDQIDKKKKLFSSLGMRGEYLVVPFHMNGEYSYLCGGTHHSCERRSTTHLDVVLDYG